MTKNQSYTTIEPILLPDAEDFKELGWLLNLNKAAKISDQESLDSLEEVLCEKLELNLVKAKSWNPCVRSFLESLQQIVNANPPKDPCYVTFASEEKEITVYPKFKVTYFSSPKNNNKQNASAIYSPVPVKAVAVSNISVNKSMVPISLEIHNEGNGLDNVGVEITCEDVRFDYSNEKSSLIIPKLFANISCKDDSCYLKVGTLNKRVWKPLSEFFIEFTDAYHVYDNAYTFEQECCPKELNLSYWISGKNESYEGELLVKVKPEFEIIKVENEKQAGKVMVEAFID